MSEAALLKRCPAPCTQIMDSCGTACGGQGQAEGCISLTAALQNCLQRRLPRLLAVGTSRPRTSVVPGLLVRQPCCQPNETEQAGHGLAVCFLELQCCHACVAAYHRKTAQTMWRRYTLSLMLF